MPILFVLTPDSSVTREWAWAWKAAMRARACRQSQELRRLWRLAWQSKSISVCTLRVIVGVLFPPLKRVGQFTHKTLYAFSKTRFNWPQSKIMPLGTQLWKHQSSSVLNLCFTENCSLKPLQTSAPLFNCIVVLHTFNGKTAKQWWVSI